MIGVPKKLKLFVLFIIFIGVSIVFFGIQEISWNQLPVLFFFLLLGVISESVAIKVNNTFSISVSFGIGLATVIIFQSSLVAVIGFLSMLLAIKVIDGKIYYLFNTPYYKRFFNGSAHAISLIAANTVFIYFNEISNFTMLEYNILSIIFSILTFAVLDIIIFSMLQSLLEDKPFFNVLSRNKWLIFNVIAIAPLGIFIAIIFKSYGMFAVLLFFGPLLLARYSFKLYIDMKNMYAETIFALSNAVDAKDQYTNGHAHRVADYAVEISRTMNFSDLKLEKIKTAAILHDIGKIGIHDMILNKPDKLEDYEFLEIQKHPLIGFNILTQVHDLSSVATIIKYHHERYNGGGYPDGIYGDQVPMESYILSVADAFDAMISDRPYRKAMDKKVAIQIIKEEAGKQFHPMVVEAFLNVINMQEEQQVYAN